MRTVRSLPLRRRSSRGQGLVEFALIFPVLIILIVGVFDMGAAVFAYNSVTNAAREAARLAIVNQDTASITARAISQTAIAETAAPNVTISFRSATPNADPTQNAVCGDPVAVGCVAVIIFQTTYRPFTPIIAQIVFKNGVTMTATTIEPVEFTCPNSTTTAANCPKQP